MKKYFTIPGWDNSGSAHWQTYFEKTLPNCQRIEQNDWLTPKLEDWLAEIDKKLAAETDLSNIVLIGHSLGCATIVHWAARSGKQIRGAFLVAPSDLETEKYRTTIGDLEGFTPICLAKMNFPSIVVSSRDDEWVSVARAEFFAENWGSELIFLEKAGHINTSAGFGDWPKGLEILNKF